VADDLPEPGPDGKIGVLYCKPSARATDLVCHGCEQYLEPEVEIVAQMLADPSLFTMCAVCADDMIEWVLGLPGGGGVA
jgi:hypothetical protein